MDRKELDAINRLFDRLDKCLVWNTTVLGKRTTEPDIDAIYELGDLIERHRYLKNEHSFAPGEAEALLGFQDPLVAAQSCWEENGFTNFPICEILKDIGAYDRFPLTKEEQERRGKPKVLLLQERLDKNLADYNAALMKKSKSELVADSEKIATTQAAYAYMRNEFDYAYGEAELLLQLDDPLHYLASQWSMTFDFLGDDGDTIQEIIEELKDPKKLGLAQKAAYERMFLVTFLVLNTADSQRQLDNNVFQASSIAQKYNCQPNCLLRHQGAGQAVETARYAGHPESGVEPRHGEPGGGQNHPLRGLYHTMDPGNRLTNAH